MARRFKSVSSTEVFEGAPVIKEDLEGKETRIPSRPVKCKKCGEEFNSDVSHIWESDVPNRVYCECPNPQCNSLNHILKVRFFE